MMQIDMAVLTKQVADLQAHRFQMSVEDSHLISRLNSGGAVFSESNVRLIRGLYKHYCEGIKLSTEDKKLSLLQKAQEIISNDREKTYGSPDKNLKTIAAYWATHLNAKYDKNISLTIDDVCEMMVLLKVARLANDPKHYDSMLDIAGYIALQERCQQYEQNAKEWKHP